MVSSSNIIILTIVKYLAIPLAAPNAYNNQYVTAGHPQNQDEMDR
jgi:hypothetical protein